MAASTALPSAQRDIGVYFAAPVARMPVAQRAPAARHSRLSCRVFGHVYQQCADETFNLWTACARCGQSPERS